MAHLSRIDIFPVKSLDGVSVESAEVLPSGALKGDRAYALLDGQGRFINGKRSPRIHQLRATFSADLQTISLKRPDSNAVFTGSLDGDRSAIEDWLSEFFERAVRLGHNPEQGFPDDTDAPGPTVISTATLETVASWYPDLTLGQVRRRFRTNLEVDGVSPFWEDQLFGEIGLQVPFKVGKAGFLGIKPCQRCVVPTRDALTGEATAQFQQTFTYQRDATLPAWTARSRFNHFYRLAVNTRLSPQTESRVMQVGDPISVLGTVVA